MRFLVDPGCKSFPMGKNGVATILGAGHWGNWGCLKHVLSSILKSLSMPNCPSMQVDNSMDSSYGNDVLVEESGGRYISVFDPLDGSSNVDAGIPVGTIFGIFQEVHQPCTFHFLLFEFRPKPFATTCRSARACECHAPGGEDLVGAALFTALFAHFHMSPICVRSIPFWHIPLLSGSVV